jgi:hypothetical protein
MTDDPASKTGVDNYQREAGLVSCLLRHAGFIKTESKTCTQLSSGTGRAKVGTVQEMYENGL